MRQDICRGGTWDAGRGLSSSPSRSRSSSPSSPCRPGWRFPWEPRTGWPWCWSLWQRSSCWRSARSGAGAGDERSRRPWRAPVLRDARRRPAAGPDPRRGWGGRRLPDADEAPGGPLPRGHLRPSRLLPEHPRRPAGLRAPTRDGRRRRAPLDRPPERRARGRRRHQFRRDRRPRPAEPAPRRGAHTRPVRATPHAVPAGRADVAGLLRRSVRPVSRVRRGQGSGDVPGAHLPGNGPAGHGTCAAQRRQCRLLVRTRTAAVPGR